MENTSKDSGFNTESPSSSLDSEEQFINWSEDESAPDSESEFNRQRRRDLLDVLVEIVLKQRRGNRHERERARRRRRHRRHLYESRSRPDTPEPLMKGKRRKCPIHDCGKRFINVTHHYTKYHPDVDKQLFCYDNLAKELGIGKYKNYVGFKCSFCGQMRMCFEAHCRNVHINEVDVKSPEFQTIKENCRISHKVRHR
uniref:uncharacterized protein LOC100177081 isoform X2 n=1 Tax=Ciona intestinalis TaxID=7719 RepID=UPI00006A5ABD|nr:uncharacterized protein LOC100177081 isoform X2 [Ciona intestinalis]|eukprot:XP_026691387.1 uncharacterized protein LOC100177081 isoform X2 [Ciona intestinalis]